jgi:hypothetical protein
MKHIILLLSFVALCIAGCGGNVPMGGRVTYSDTGEPVEFGMVSFSTQTKQSRAEIKEDGRYVIGTFGDKDGLPKGEYSVMVYAAKSEGSLRTVKGVPGDKGKEYTRTETTTINLIDPKYQNPETSGLKVIVDGKTKTFDIQVERAAAVKKQR